ncbi:copper resistance protein NlpE [Motilimonas eburnea]|uniref:copper resistance protein NlpE n=1 Tax=Motilimonas eburnea TaxID=1737488 RepID=UPI001E297B52|nr:copper resistance protein NlpE [Motilimonas eburnea]MCE2573105.1 copper resistance protein NlpE N-terminal domain-containing protein [Motilimonas eburnea]
MKRVLLFPLLGSLALVGCQSESANTQPTPEPEVIEAVVEEVVVAEVTTEPQLPVGDSAKVSLDWNGTYRGTLPCEDCDGIEILLELKPDNTYALSRNYLGKMGAAVIEEAPFNWNDAGNTITLEDGTQLFVGENRLWLVDDNGQRVMDEAHQINKEL